MPKFVRFSTGDLTGRYGLLTDQEVVELDGSVYEAWTTTDCRYSLDQVRLLAPCEPTKIVCVGTNYKQVLAAKERPTPKEPVIFLKPSSAMAGPEDTIVYPPGLEKLGYEVELAVVIKDKAKDVSQEEALQHVLGYTVANDITAKDFMGKGPWTKGKSFDTFLPLGPCIATEIDPYNTNLRSFLNGELTQDSNTGDMVFSVADIICYVSKIMTLYPGDVLATGTPLGAGLAKPGDALDLFIEGIGTLSNRVG